MVLLLTIESSQDNNLIIAYRPSLRRGYTVLYLIFRTDVINSFCIVLIFFVYSQKKIFKFQHELRGKIREFSSIQLFPKKEVMKKFHFLALRVILPSQFFPSNFFPSSIGTFLGYSGFYLRLPFIPSINLHIFLLTVNATTFDDVVHLIYSTLICGTV